MAAAAAAEDEDAAAVSLIPGLPDDLAIHCLLRIPFTSHGPLRCVCRRWRSLLFSPSFFVLRENLHFAEDRLYAMFRTRDSLAWLVFSCELRSWLPLPPLPRQQIGTTCASAARKVYIIGGSQGERSSRNVWSFDPVFSRWERRAPMSVSREFAACGTISGLIYVLGGFLPGSSINGAESWAEVYNPSTDVWRNVPSPPDKRYKWMHGNIVLHDKLYAVADMGGIIFDPSCSSWESIPPRLDRGWKSKAAVVKDILFSSDNLGKIWGYDVEQDVWLELHGWQNDLPRIKSSVSLTGVAGKLYMLWEISESQLSQEKNCILAALEISKQPRLLTAKVLWSHVSKLPGMLIHAVSLSL